MRHTPRHHTLRQTARLCAVIGGLASLPFGIVSPAQAQQPDHPPFMPTRDVSVTYDVQPEGVPTAQRIGVLFSGGGRLMRVNGPDGQGATILDRDKRLMTVIINGAKVYMQAPEREELRSPFLLDASMTFVPVGHGRVAGLDCMRWSITAASGKAAACVTADGVVLSQEGVDSQGVRGHLTAQSVVYGPIPATLFQPPADYSRVAHPEGPASYERGGAQGNGPVTGPQGMGAQGMGSAQGMGTPGNSP